MTHDNQKDIINDLSIDCAIFGFEDATLKVLLVQRNIEPEKGKWALPGGFILQKEDTDDSAKRILNELTGVNNIFLEQYATFGKVNRYPLRRVVTIAYYALIKPGNYVINAGVEAMDAKWFNVQYLPELVFDHREIMDMALHKLRRKTRYEPIGFELLPEKFPLLNIQELYEAINDVKYDKPNFRRKIQHMNLLVPLNEKQIGVAHRSARLFKFDKKRYASLKEKGFNFEI